ncbi:MAG: SDR family oxidoreductase [Negativicutes bacterium]|nr:SDR family oxidoreductase [Negativicutes bacterium]
MRFAGKVALVTGAGAGIGRATAELLAKAGAKVVVNGISRERGEATLKLVKAAGTEGLFVQGDVSIAAHAERLVKETVGAFGRIDILINVAGIVIGGRVDNMSEEDFMRTMDVNVKGTFLTCKYAVSEMKKQGGGVIVNVSSVAALKGIPDRSAYSASKGAVLALSKAMAADYIKDNIRVNVVCPGTTDTPSLEERMQTAADPAAARAAFIARQPMGRLGTAEEIAHAILFACCDEAGFMNGSVITIDGGATL